ncbi:ATP-binding protein [Thermococcus sp. 18S1]|uniref:ATP-binding protein n=1 Tax=Thermococcus sp. 18S1 TaxID=1638210 RepID=UPI00143BE7AD|nr:ATP-binding protein [Thermococcus sp. 18S1]
MLFDVRPKIRMEEVYGREAEYLEFMDKLRKGRNLFVIVGPRRIGKTSFLFASLNELYSTEEIPHVVIDARKVYSINSKYPERVMAEELYLARKGQIGRAIAKIEGISVKGFGVRVRRRSASLPDELITLNNAYDRVIVAFDEAQYLRFANTDFTTLLAWAYDNLRNVVIVLTGSQVGVLDKFLRFKDYGAPLYGRYHVRLTLPRFNPSESLGFLKRGFEEAEMNVPSQELLATIKALDGVPGWLTHYGAYRIDGNSHERALELVLEEAKGYVMSEFKELERASPRYRLIMETVANRVGDEGSVSWSEIKNALHIRLRKPVSDSELANYLKRLIDYGFLEQVGTGDYRIPDPVIKRVFGE